MYHKVTIKKNVIYDEFTGKGTIHSRYYWRHRDAESMKVKTYRYGITEKLFISILGNQLGRCAICCIPMIEPCVDHNHKTGEIRGLLCHGCNLQVGRYENMKRSQIEYYLEIV